MKARLLEDKYLYALELVARLFEGHKRKVSGVPFVTHLLGVCSIVQKLTNDEEVHLAALLHDVLEDIPAEQYSAQQMQKDFGPRVTQLVHTVSYDEEYYGEDEQKQQYLKQLKTGAVEACLISGADMLYNGRDIIFWYRREPQKTAAALGGERVKRRTWFWQERLNIIETKLGADHRLVKDLREMLTELSTVHQKIM